MWRAPRGCTSSCAFGRCCISRPTPPAWSRCTWVGMTQSTALHVQPQRLQRAQQARHGEVGAGVDEGGAALLDDQVGGIKHVAVEAGVDGVNAMRQRLQIRRQRGRQGSVHAVIFRDDGPASLQAANYFTCKVVRGDNAITSRRRSTGTAHAHRLHRRRPRRPLLRAADEAVEPGAPHHGGGAQQALRHLRLGRGVQRRDDGEHAAVGPPRRPIRSRSPSTTGTTSNCTSRAPASAVAAMGLSASAARSC